MRGFSFLLASFALLFTSLSIAGNSSYKIPPPEVIPEVKGGLIPANLEAAVSLNTMIQIGFTKSLNEDITSSKFYLTANAQRVPSNVYDYGSYVILKPVEHLKPSTTYSVVFDSFTENGLDRKWTFTTGDTLNEDSPSLVSTKPVQDDIDVNPKNSINIAFDRNMNPMSFTKENFLVFKRNLESMEPEWIQVTSGVVRYNFQEKKVKYFPDYSLPYDREIRIKIIPDTITDFYGNPLTDNVDLSFYTDRNGSQTFTSTLFTQEFVVPEGVNEISIYLEGAQGGDGSGCGYIKGKEGSYGWTKSTTDYFEPGDIIKVRVGEGGDGGDVGFLDKYGEDGYGKPGEDGEDTRVESHLFGSIIAWGGSGGKAASLCDDGDSLKDGEDGDDGEVRLSW